jgi:hypothetical protein
MLLEKARERAATQRVWMKSVLLERRLGDTTRARGLLDAALQRFPGKFNTCYRFRHHCSPLYAFVPHLTR